MALKQTDWAALIKELPMSIAFFDFDMRYVAYSNEWFLENKQTAKGELTSLVGESQYELFPEMLEAHPEWRTSHDKAFKGEASTKKVDLYKRPGDGFVFLQWWVGPWKNEKDEIIGCVMVTADNTDAHQLERYFALINDGLCSVKGGFFLRTNKWFENILGRSANELEGTSIESYIHPDDVGKTRKALGALAGGESVSNFVNRYRAKSGAYKDLEWGGTMDPETKVVFGLARDVTDRILQEKKFANNTKLLRALMQVQEKYISGAEIRSVFDEVLTILLKLTESEYGFIGQVLKKPDGDPYLKTYAITNIAWSEDTQRFYEENASEGLEFHNLETLFGYTLKTGEMVISNDPATDPRSGGLPKGHPDLNTYLGLPLLGRDGMVGMVGVANRKEGYNEKLVEDFRPLFRVLGSIIDSSRGDEKLRKMAMFDHLTRLHNRVAMESEMIAMTNAQTPFALLYIDLDRFKNINDTLGHHIGDYVLKEVATNLLQLCRAEDIVARVGGDEFSIVLKGQSSERVVGEFTDRLISLIREPFSVGNEQVSIGCCVGIAMYPAHGNAISTLMQHADFALYKAKGFGSDQYHFYDKAFSESHVRRLDIESRLEGAIQNDELSLLYQPIVDLKTKKIVSFEALVRWVHPTLGMLVPTEFVQIAEDLGLIDQLEIWVMRNAIKQYQSWCKGAKDELAININLSPQHLVMEKHSALLVKTLQEVKNAEDNIIIEVTESALSSSMVALEDLLKSLVKMGIKIAVDDFGTGHSTLSRLRTITAHSLKIDASFVEDIASDEKSAMIVKSLITLGHNLGMDVVAEGIERQTQLTLLTEMGCDRGQGYFFSKPMRAGEVKCDEL